MKIKHLELYTDYLIVNAAGYATATGLSAMMDGEISHDQMTRSLSKQEFSSKDLWLEVKANDRINSPEIKKRMEQVKKMRLASPKIPTQKLAETPYLFGEIR